MKTEERTWTSEKWRMLANIKERERERERKGTCKLTFEPNSVIMSTWAPSPLRNCGEPVFSHYS